MYNILLISTHFGTFHGKNNQNLVIIFIIVMETGHEYGSLCVLDVKIM